MPQPEEPETAQDTVGRDPQKWPWLLIILIGALRARGSSPAPIEAAKKNGGPELRSRDGENLAFRIEVQRSPTQPPARFSAALPLMQRVASRPFTQLRGDLVRGNDFGV